MKDKNKKQLIIILVIVLIISIFTGLFLFNKINNKPISNEDASPITVDSSITMKYMNEIEEYDDFYGYSDDYIGIIKFESNLIDLPFVQAKIETTAQDAYDKYLRTDWITMGYDEEGSIFMDPYNQLNDQNLVIYGHYVYPEYDSSGTHKFTPLHLLKEESNYEDNKYIQLILNDEIRRYEIANVYYAKTEMNSDQPLEEGMEYMFSNFSKEALQYYIKRVNEEEFYDTGVEIGPDDKFLTLQTCVENRDDLKLIVIAKEIEVVKIR